MIGLALLREHPLPRHPRFLVLNWAFDLPWISAFIRRVGGVVASPYNALRLLQQDHLVAVFPEGVKGTGKPFAERYRLQRFGRGGFVEIALRAGAPFAPITPTFPWLGPLGLVPLPSKWRIESCEPVDLSEYGLPVPLTPSGKTATRWSCSSRRIALKGEATTPPTLRMPLEIQGRSKAQFRTRKRG